jgi:hypothetical protein
MLVDKDAQCRASALNASRYLAPGRWCLSLEASRVDGPHIRRGRLSN